jgi:hypothetical protein
LVQDLRICLFLVSTVSVPLPASLFVLFPASLFALIPASLFVPIPFPARVFCFCALVLVFCVLFSSCLYLFSVRGGTVGGGGSSRSGVFCPFSLFALFLFPLALISARFLPFLFCSVSVCSVSGEVVCVMCLVIGTAELPDYFWLRWRW